LKASASSRLRAWAAAIVSIIAPTVPIAQESARPQSTSAVEEPITPIPKPPAADPRKLALGERLFSDPRLSHDNTRACMSCHDITYNGTRRVAAQVTGGGLPYQLDTPTVFNAALSFRLSWEGRCRTVEAQVAASLASPETMHSSADEAAAKLRADPGVSDEFRVAYGHEPDGSSLVDALATFGRSLLTPGSRFDRWLSGDSTALSARELDGYHLFKSLGCVSCHQGVNIGGNLFQRHGIFRPLAARDPVMLRVPSLRNVAVTPPYFHDGSAPTLEDAVRKMGAAQLNSDLSDAQIATIVAFLRTLTGQYAGHLVGEKQ
jgi:cytochrome c peroxidase